MPSQLRPTSVAPTLVLVGNPNSGKSSLFNEMTGLRQKTGNFPGVTVDKKEGFCALGHYGEARVLDLPGTYSLYPKSQDERVVLDILANPQSADYPDLAVVVADASNLKRNLLLFTEIRDLGVPVVLALNMLDVAQQAGLEVHLDPLRRLLHVPVVSINARKGEGLDELKRTICQALDAPAAPPEPFFVAHDHAPGLLTDLRASLGLASDYLAWQYAQQSAQMHFLDVLKRQRVRTLVQQHGFEPSVLQAKETIARYENIAAVVRQSVTRLPTRQEREPFSQRLDQVFLHRFWGYLIFFAILFLMFQAIFVLAQYPMDAIDGGVAALNNWLKDALPPGRLVDLLTDGLIAGMGGVVIFIPQIALLFAFISILEESGYMARVMFIMDQLMRKFGLNGKSVVPLISGAACAVPAIMATRNIGTWKDRLITIFVTPLISCSARLPIYTILIGLVVPDRRLGGIINLQGVVLMGLYLLGFAAALLSAWLMKALLRTKERSWFIMELPTYKMPRWNHVGLTIVEKVKAFVFEAGKVIVAISVVLWVLASYGPGDRMQRAEAAVRQQYAQLPPAQLDNFVASARLEHSYAGYFGKAIEPAIRPLGYDWKIGIALITSFAAREVFVGTMSTIYSLGSQNADATTVKARMRAELNPATGKPMYSLALSASLLVFYAFAMQCMSTLAVVYRETRGWKWPLIQLAYMTALAYVSALLTYQLLK